MVGRVYITTILQNVNRKIAEQYIELAKSEALSIPRINKHVSLVFHNNILVAIGTNKRKTSTFSFEYGYRYSEMHSEVAAMHKIRWLLRKQRRLDIVNYHFNRYGLLKLAKPCQCCRMWIHTVFDRVFYSTPFGINELHDDSL